MATEPMEYAKDVLVLLYNNPAYFLSFFDCIGNRGLFFQVLLLSMLSESMQPNSQPIEPNSEI